ncbi:MAG: hypothetical protein R2822_21780 [Spirosomataceae bacterium]
MKKRFIQLFLCLLMGFPTMAQYGYGGGYGYGGYGRGMRSQIPQTPNTPKKPPTSDEIAEDQTKWLNKKVKLNEDQAISVEMLFLDYALKLTDFQELYMKSHANTRPTPQEIQQIKTMMDEWNTEKEGKLKAILTPEQWGIYEKKKKAMPYGPQQ